MDEIERQDWGGRGDAQGLWQGQGERGASASPEMGDTGAVVGGEVLPPPPPLCGAPPPRFGENLGGDLVSVPSRGRAGEELSKRTSRVTRVDLVDEGALDFAPYVHAAPRRNSITPDKQRRFIATLAATGIVSQAARGIGASVEALYKLRHREGAEGFAAAWDAAVERGYTRLEDCALERAIAGEVRPVVSRGKVVATWTHHNTALLMFLLRTRRPEKYGAVKLADLREGHPVYEALKMKWAAERDAEDMARADEVRQSLHARLLAMRDEVLASKALRQAQDQAMGDSGVRDVDGRGGGEAQGVCDLDHVGQRSGFLGGEAFEAGEEGAAGLDEIGGGAFQF